MKKKKNGFKKILIALSLLVLLFIVGSYYFIQKGLKPVDVSSDEVIEVEIPMGSSKNKIASILEEKELINNSFIYNLYLQFSDKKEFKAGTYLMSPSMSLEEIIHYLNEGASPIKPEPKTRLTVAEGLTIEKIAEQVEKQTDFSSEDFMDSIQNQEFINSLCKKYPDLLTDALNSSSETRYTMEGYLYPATYEVYEETELEDLIEEMVEEMDRTLKPYYKEIEDRKNTVHEILTLASYIEGEGVSDEDRELISGVFYNRLKEGMLLRTDPSISYALGEHRERILYKDLEIDSPYNTYRYSGIGPGPVNNPSISAIKASINPAQTDYLFFLADLKTKEIYFSKDYDQHLKYKRKYLDND